MKKTVLFEKEEKKKQFTEKRFITKTAQRQPASTIQATSKINGAHTNTR